MLPEQGGSKEEGWMCSSSGLVPVTVTARFPVPRTWSHESLQLDMVTMGLSPTEGQRALSCGQPGTAVSTMEQRREGAHSLLDNT